MKQASHIASFRGPTRVNGCKFEQTCPDKFPSLPSLSTTPSLENMPPAPCSAHALMIDGHSMLENQSVGREGHSCRSPLKLATTTSIG